MVKKNRMCIIDSDHGFTDSRMCRYPNYSVG